MAVHEFEVDELYTMMLALKNHTPKGGAFKAATRVRAVERADNGLFNVRLSVLDDDCVARISTSAVFDAQGFWTDVVEQGVHVNGTPVTKAFLRDYDDPFGAELNELTNGLLLSAGRYDVLNITP